MDTVRIQVMIVVAFMWFIFPSRYLFSDFEMVVERRRAGVQGGIILLNKCVNFVSDVAVVHPDL